ncbi:glycosyltransferase [Arcobacter cryaerophilus gv. pseudocryaerophilus]|uniref:Glycosyltransferase n=3 Tax=unclassified Arcobacter TaxID=2593671 RepID=A0AA96DWX6_9BACT|nr:glycosyltransferase [Arcobacter sp. AZ-2023]WPD06412.1 glycosyltransferase [Arcobacter sp. DSM 115956]WPD08503.1 glycosyltransferase [Arcobacter sp. DSM 115955]WNL32768.1 glycosyltransferase [Arcobacter sp. AZ-2023]WNP38918.1 glycosyltransferase [Arcobacter sp. AZ-2023]
MKVSVIIAVYKDVEALELIIESLKNQTYKNFEVIIAEDGQDEKMQAFIKSIKDLDIKHTTQEDIGIRKTRSLNNGIIASEGEFLIFIDGDCIPYSTFIESYVKISQDGFIISGRRVNLGPKYSKKLRNKIISPLELEKTFLLRYIFISQDCKEGHSEDGFYFSPDGWIYNKFIKNRKASTSILGCNYACFKKDIIAINGYDEGYGETAIGDDTDLEWRFKALGCKIKSAKNVANVFHLYHSRSFRNRIDTNKYLEIFKENKLNNKFICTFGLSSH